MARSLRGLVRHGVLQVSGDGLQLHLIPLTIECPPCAEWSKTEDSFRWLILGIILWIFCSEFPARQTPDTVLIFFAQLQPAFFKYFLSCPFYVKAFIFCLGKPESGPEELHSNVMTYSDWECTSRKTWQIWHASLLINGLFFFGQLRHYINEPCVSTLLIQDSFCHCIQTALFLMNCDASNSNAITSNKTATWFSYNVYGRVNNRPSERVRRRESKTPE